MTTSNTAFTGSVPSVYHQHLGPLYFVPYARALVQRVPKDDHARVLELACGTGILTAELVSSLAGTAAITATDLNAGMIDIARGHVASPRVQWQTADATNLPFGDRAFDLVVCQYGAMFFPDKVEAARQVRRVLRPGGQYWFSVWGTLAENPISLLTDRTINRFFTADPPTFYQVPFGYSDARQIADDLTRGGFAEVAIETVDIEARAPSAEHAAVGTVQGSPVVHAICERGAAPPEEVTRAVAAVLDREFGPGEIRAPLRAHFVRAQ